MKSQYYHGVWEGFIHKDLGCELTAFQCHTQHRVFLKMASASVLTDGEFLDYTKEEMDEILQEVERFEREEMNESDVDMGEGGEGEEEEESDADDDIPLSAFVTTWRPATCAPVVQPFEEETGPNHDLPLTATPLDFFFLFLPQFFFYYSCCSNKPVRQAANCKTGTT